MELYAFYTNETNEVHYISGYSAFDAIDMIELAGYTVSEYLGILISVTVESDLPSYDVWALQTYGNIPA